MERKQIFYESGEAGFTLNLKRVECLWKALKLESLAVPSKPTFYKKASDMVVVLLKENAKHTNIETTV